MQNDEGGSCASILLAFNFIVITDKPLEL